MDMASAALLFGTDHDTKRRCMRMTKHKNEAAEAGRPPHSPGFMPSYAAVRKC